MGKFKALQQHEVQNEETSEPVDDIYLIPEEIT